MSIIQTSTILRQQSMYCRCSKWICPWTPPWPKYPVLMISSSQNLVAWNLLNMINFYQRFSRCKLWSFATSSELVLVPKSTQVQIFPRWTSMTSHVPRSQRYQAYIAIMWTCILLVQTEMPVSSKSKNYVNSCNTTILFPLTTCKCIH